MVTGWIKGLLGPGGMRGADVSGIRPEARFVAVGDIHGRLDLLQALLPKLDEGLPWVFVGDYIDRGDYSAQVLRQLKHLSLTSNGRVTCLLGNHEEMLLRFLEDPFGIGPLWMNNGGVQTLASFGIKDVDADKGDLADRLRIAMGEGLVDWLTERPLMWTSGNVSVVHAALDPRASAEKQNRRTCLWGHPKFRQLPRRDGQWVVHGHTIVDQAEVRDGVISIDTGAFATNCLTAAELYPGGVTFTATA